MAETGAVERMSKPWLMTSWDDSRKPRARDKAEAGGICGDSCQAALVQAAHLQMWVSQGPKHARNWWATYEFSTRSVVYKWDSRNSNLWDSEP